MRKISAKNLKGVTQGLTNPVLTLSRKLSACALSWTRCSVACLAQLASENIRNAKKTAIKWRLEDKPDRNRPLIRCFGCWADHTCDAVEAAITLQRWWRELSHPKPTPWRPSTRKGITQGLTNPILTLSRKVEQSGSQPGQIQMDGRDVV